MAYEELVSRLDSIIELTEAFSPVFLELHHLRSAVAAEAVTVADPWNDPAYVEARYQEWLERQAAAGGG
jgi:hypothetical protein